MPRPPRRACREATDPWRSLALALAIALGPAAPGLQAGTGPSLTPETMPRVPAHEPADAARTFQIRPGFRAELVAAEPLVQSPVAVAVDESGAAYVVEMRDYSERRPEALGRIRRLTDTDGDGRYDQATVFLDNLPWPTAVTCWDGGIFLGATPDLLYARDTTGDGVADVREVVFTGFADRYAPFATNQLNVQALLNSLQWGPDGRIHGATSASGGTVRRVDSAFTRAWRGRAGDASQTATAAPVPLSGRDFSFDPRTLALRAEPGGGQHGMTFDDAGRKFVCSNSDHLQWLAYAEQDVPPNPFHDLPGPRRSIAADGPAAEVFRRSPDEPWRVLRTRWRVAGVVEGMIEGGGRPSGYFTGATGVTLYRGDAYGPGFLGDAFIADCGSNLLHRKKLRRPADGSGWVGERAADEARSEFLASTDNWFRPVQFYNAPDGCLWVVDMYRETIEHPWSIPPNLKRNLDLDSGRTRGRLWRIAPDDAPRGRGARPVARRTPTPELVGLLSHANSWHRDVAARLLAERADPAALPELRRLLLEGRSALARRQAIALLGNADALDAATVLRATQDPDDAVRRQAFQRAARSPSAAASAAWLERLVAAAAEEKDEEVQLAIAFALGASPAPPASRLPGLAPLLASRSALVRAAALHAAGGAEAALWSDQVRDPQPDVPPVLRELTFVLGRRAQAAEVRPALQRLLRLQPPATAQSLAATLAEGLARGGHRLSEFLPADDLVAWMGSTRAAVASRPTEPALRLLAWDPAEAAGRQLLSAWATVDDALAAAAASSLRQHPSLLTNAAALRDAWMHAPVARRPQLTDLWLRHPDGARTLLAVASAPDRALDPTTWSAGQVTALRNHADPGVREAARRLLGEPPASRQAVVDQFASALSLAGQPARGEQAFRERCATCHAFRGQGVALGPDLASVAANGPEKLLVAILDPNREVAPNFAAWTLETADGETLSGIQVRESTANVTLRVAGGTESTVERARIRSLETAGRSLMPEGLEQGWRPQDLADLLSYLAGGVPGRDGAGAAAPGRWTTVAGTGRRATEGAIATADLASPFGLVRGPDGALWFCEFEGHRIRRLDPQGQLTTIAGTGRPGYSGDGGPATAATLNQPHELRFDRAGDLYVADTGNHVLRRIDPRTGRITTHAGTGEAGYSGDGGPARAARLKSPISLQFGPDGDLYVCDIGNHVVRRVAGRTGVVSTFAGTGAPGPTPDGSPIRGTPLHGPRSLDFDARGDLWLVTREGNQLLRVDLGAGRFLLQAGTGRSGFSGNGGPGRSAALGGPKGVAVGPDGRVYLADTENHAIRRFDPRTGVLELVAGDGVAGDGPRLRRPHGVWVEPDGTLLVGDSDNHRILRIGDGP